MTKQEIYQVLEAKKIILKNLSWTELDKFTKKKTLDALYGVDTKGFYVLLFFRSAKARFLSKEFEAINEIASKIVEQTGIKFKKKAIFYSSDICSKTTNLMKENGYKYDSM
nr:hypothetical protein [uncultured Campylobacter sp.]